jgi:hypothetical protein
MNLKPPLLRVCQLLNEAGAKYLVCGAQACILREGVSIPFLGLEALIASKETYREQDAVDRARLLALQRQNRG